MRLLLEIESELGPLAALLCRFHADDWRLADLVSLVHMLLDAAGIEEDYMALGDEMLQAGLPTYLAAAREFLEGVITCRP